MNHHEKKRGSSHSYMQRLSSGGHNGGERENLGRRKKATGAKEKRTEFLGMTGKGTDKDRGGKKEDELF